MAQTADFTYHQEEKSKSMCLCKYPLPYPDISIRRIVTNWQFDFSKSWCNPALRNAVGCKNVYTKPWQINALSLWNKKNPGSNVFSSWPWTMYPYSGDLGLPSPIGKDPLVEHVNPDWMSMGANSDSSVIYHLSSVISGSFMSRTNCIRRNINWASKSVNHTQSCI